MSKPPLKLTENEMNESILEVIKPSIKFIDKKIVKVLDFLKNKHKAIRIDSSDFINMVLCVGWSIDLNILRSLCEVHFENTGEKMNYPKLAEGYIANLQSALKEDLKTYYKEKLN